MANENRDILNLDKQIMLAHGADWQDEDFRKEYFDELDHWHAGQKVGPMPEWMIWKYVRKYRIKKQEPEKPKKTPQLVK